MRPAAERLAVRLQQIEFSAPRIRVINNVDVSMENEPERIRDALVRQAYSPVRWVETIQKMAAMGVTVVAECGPGKVLAGLTKRCAEGVGGIALADASSIDSALST
jgi:[acyl-carrier-protein] S-malonyltransferase